MKTSRMVAIWKMVQTAGLVVAALAMVTSARAGFAPYPYTEGFESGINTNYWTLQGTWGPTWEASHAGSTCLTDSPWPWYVYDPNEDASATVGVDLRFAARRPMLTFWQLNAFETGVDYGFVEVSADQGASWTRLVAVTGNSMANWTQVKVDLTGYAGAQVLIRFHLRSNASYQYDGWYIDDLEVKENPTLFAYPFYDGMSTSASQTNWLSSSWQLVTGSATNAATGMSWRCNFGSGYQPGGLPVNAYLTMAGTMDFTTVVSPKLSFWWRAAVQQENSFYAQISTDGGKNWTSIYSWGSYWNNSAAWNRVQVDLNAYAGYTNVTFRFLAVDPVNRDLAMDFQLDDVLVDEAPAEVSLTAGPGTDPRHNALLSWSASTATDFAYYAIYRATSPGITPSSQLLTTISNKTTTSFLDTSLDFVGQTYYYRVIVWDNQGLHNWGTNEVSFQTRYGQLVSSIPFTEGFEGADTSWSLDRPWAFSSQLARTGSKSLASNPGTNYANNTDASAYLNIDLTGANRPVLTFWQRYGLEANRDFGFVEVWLGSWTRLYGVTGQSGTNWTKVQVDLAQYTGSQVLVRFRLMTDAQNQFDGWFIDDLEVKDFGNVSFGSYFYDSMDTPSTLTNWVSSTWQLLPSSVVTNGTNMGWKCQLGGGYQPGSLGLYNYLTLAGSFNLVGAVNPKLWFWWRAATQQENALYAQVSTDNGKNWSTLWSWGSYWNNSMAWTRLQLDLNSYIGYTNLTLRFLAYNPVNRDLAIDFQIDDLRVAEQPAPAPEVTATVSAGTDPRHNAVLNWQASTAPAFAYYGLYRSTSSGVTVGNLLVAAITNRATTTFQDTNLDVCGLNYYYRVIVWDTNGLHNLGSGDLLYRTAYGQAVTSYPFSEGFEGTDANWALDRPWAISTQLARTGSKCLASNPGTNYANSADLSACLSLSLVASHRPTLTFWERYGFEPNRDFGFVEVSKDQGTNWTRIYGVTGQSGTNWVKVQLDLAEYVGSQIQVRFRLMSDAQNPYEGWYIDDVAVQDTAVALAYPFYDPMNTAASQTNWLASSWQQVPGSATGGLGMSWQFDLGNGYQPGGLTLYSMLTMAGNLNLASAVNPKLSFWWRAGVQQENAFYAQVSTDGAKTWTTLYSWGSYWNNSSSWSRPQIDLSAYAGQTNLTLRFMAYDPVNRDLNIDFQVDEVLIDEGPLDVAATIGAGPDPQHSAQLSWSASSASDFAYYVVYRSASSGVTPSSQLMTIITNKATTTFVDNTLDVIGQTYYYRVMVWDTTGLHTWGAADLAYKTTFGPVVTTLPFSESFSGGVGNWAMDRPWGLTTETSHGGVNCLASNPGTSYANSADVSAYLNINLAGANRPMLTFWQRYGFEPDRDFGFVEISLNQGASWSRLYAVTSQSGEAWYKAQVDLGAYAGSLALIRFRLVSDSANPYSGWFIDDVEIKDFGKVAMGYPFYDGMDTTASDSNWVASAWQLVPGSATSGSGMSWRCDIGNGYQPGGLGLYSSLTLAGTINLTGTTSPQLWFWWRAAAQQENSFFAQVSTDSGKNWSTVYSWGSYWNNSVAWTRVQADLSAYVGYTNLSLRFLVYDPPNRDLNMDFQVDEILVGPGGGVPAFMTTSPLPQATLGFAYSLTLQATNGTTPYSWSVASNSLPPGLLLNPTTGIIDGTPNAVGNYNFWLKVAASNGLSATKLYSMAVQDYVAVSAAQAAQSFTTPGTNVVNCQFSNQTGRRLLSLVWGVTLPAGWTAISAQGDGNPEVGPDGNILFQAAYLTNNPLKFSYKVRVPTAQTTPQVIGGTATFLLEGMANEATVTAFPNPLYTVARRFHSADCNTNWVIETTEASRVLAYWRAQTYRLDPSSCDGYAPGAGDQVGPLHSADYLPPAWYLNGTEANRVLAFWRAGCYKPDTNGVDGFAVCGAGKSRLDLKDDLTPVVVQQVPFTYKAGSSFMLTNILTYTTPLASLLWRPQLPAGWTVSEVFADGAPESLNGEMLWTAATLPPSPVTVLYIVQVPAGEQGPKSVQNEVEYQTMSMANAASVLATPSPATLYTAFLQFTGLKRLANGSVRLDLVGAVDNPVRIQAVNDPSSTSWTTLTTLPKLGGATSYTDTTATNLNTRFYRLVSP